MIIDLENKKINKYGWFLQKREEFDLVDIKGVGYIHRKFMNGLYISYKDVNSNLRKKIMRGDASISDYVLTVDYTKSIEKYFRYIAAQNGVKFDDIYETSSRKKSTSCKPTTRYPASAYRDRKATALKLKGNVLLKVLVFSVPGLLFIGAGLYAQLRLDKSGNFMYITGVVINLAIFILCRNNVFANWYYDDIGIFTVGLLGYGRVINAIEWKDVKEIGCYTYLCKTYIKDFYISDHVIDDDDIDSEIYSKDLIKLEIANGEEVKHASPYDRLEEDFLKKIKSHVNLKWKNRKSRDVK